ncbi:MULTISPECIES: DUF5809 family protein [Haloferax]|uniref:Uncharacterized protein n=1 Tax=Haloferax massiliensis TaxID=1476858 RepID=A0A0D6JMQ1_9EURY|nr:MULTISPECIES: DUF5809 family protein [Haloferax]MDS0242973.1 DUF5809 family protein [Haloferax sp. S2CR25]MDS0446094.1 DUF5809 family protein [Haloferax sp. S2CR25-2]CQR48858.1 hypothetical protein BN996_00307 [Haloferax massiliensis]
METHGTIAPASLDEAEAAFDRVGPTAQVVVRETAKAMEFDREEYRDRVTGDVVETVRNALFAESLSVTVGTRAEFDDWRAAHEDYELVELGNPDVERVAWHAVPFAETVLATTFQHEEDAAVSTLRRNAFGRVYRDALLGEESEGGDDESAGADDDTATDAGGLGGDATGADR